MFKVINHIARFFLLINLIDYQYITPPAIGILFNTKTIKPAGNKKAEQ